MSCMVTLRQLSGNSHDALAVAWAHGMHAPSRKSQLLEAMCRCLQKQWDEAWLQGLAAITLTPDTRQTHDCESVAP